MYTWIFSNTCIVLDFNGNGDTTRSGVSSETQSTPNVVSPLIHTLDTSRPDKYKRREKESNETNGK
jgi:hypothetical protein